MDPNHKSSNHDDLTFSALDMIAGRSTTLLVIAVVCIVFHHYVTHWTPAARFEALDSVWKHIGELHDEGVKAELLQGDSRNAFFAVVIPTELLRRRERLRQRIFTAAHYKWIPKAMIIETLKGISLEIYQCEMDLRGVHADLAKRLATARDDARTEEDSNVTVSQGV